MSQLPQLEEQKAIGPQGMVMLVLVLALAVIFVGPPALMGSLLVYRRLKDTDTVRPKLQLLAAAGVSVLFASLLWPRLAQLYDRVLAEGRAALVHAPGDRTEAHLWSALTMVWLSMTPLIPLGAILMGLLDRIAQLLRPRTLAEQLAQEEKWLHERERRLSERARKHEGDSPAAQPARLRLGPYIKGDVFPAGMGIQRTGRWLTLDEDLLDQHIFILGSTGAGKSETIKRLACEILTSTARDLFLVDGKGEEKLAGVIRALAYRAGRGEAPVFRLGLGRPGAIYDGFRGAPQDVYSRLAAMIGVSEAEGDARYYADINRDLLQLICYAPAGPPRDFEEVRARLNRRWLMAAWKKDPGEWETVQRLKDPEIEGLARRVRPLAREFAPIVGPEGFALEETRCAVFSIRTQSVSDTARRFLHFLIEDLKDFIGKRQKRPGVLIIDEFGAFGNSNIIALLSLARSAKLGIILATQDVASLGDEAAARQILAYSRTKVLMATDFPEEVASLAGTIYQVESSMQHEAGAATGLGSARIQHAFKVDMNEAARLQPGEGFLIRQRYAAKLRISAVTDVPPAPEENLSPRRGQSPGAPAGADESGGEGIEL